tara:strand:+ start:175 stop:648 length:474 start_codon:yes stop_codon:yes gene_type:complete
MKNQLKTPHVYDRIRLACPGRNLVLEYIDGYDQLTEEHYDEWRVIDIDTGEVFGKSPTPQDVTPIAADMTCVKGSPDPEYVREVLRRKYITFKEVPLADKLRHVESHAKDLEHDFSLDGIDDLCPLEAAMEDYQQRYSHECWYQEEDGQWEIDHDLI